MTISEKIFVLLKQRNMTQRKFSELTGIAPSSISDWKRLGTNPLSSKIFIICQVLDVSPAILLDETIELYLEDEKKEGVLELVEQEDDCEIA